MNNCLNKDENKSNLPKTNSRTTDEVYDNVKDKVNQTYFIRFNYMAYLLIILIIIFK